MTQKWIEVALSLEKYVNFLDKKEKLSTEEDEVGKNILAMLLLVKNVEFVENKQEYWSQIEKEATKLVSLLNEYFKF